jgi:hypothetical protein
MREETSVPAAPHKAAVQIPTACLVQMVAAQNMPLKLVV